MTQSFVSGLPPAPTLIVANEFFDTLPVRQFEKTFQGWCERLVSIKDGRLGFTPWPLDAAMAFLIPTELREAVPGLQFMHLTGPADFEKIRDGYAAQNVPARVHPFFDQMGTALAAADVAVSRAGASSWSSYASRVSSD